VVVAAEKGMANIRVNREDMAIHHATGTPSVNNTKKLKTNIITGRNSIIALVLLNLKLCKK
jgi:hypothetical protein